jgi:hypothetical protein
MHRQFAVGILPPLGVGADPAETARAKLARARRAGFGAGGGCCGVVARMGMKKNLRNLLCLSQGGENQGLASV